MVIFQDLSSAINKTLAGSDTLYCIFYWDVLIWRVDFIKDSHFLCK